MSREISIAEIGVRSTLAEMARVLSFMESCEAEQYFAILAENIEKVRHKEHPHFWRQAVKGLDGMRSYGLERIGFLPPAGAVSPVGEESELDEEDRLDLQRREQEEEGDLG